MPEEEASIKTQITDAETVIERELGDFYKRHPNLRSKPEPEQATKEEEKANKTSKETMGEPQSESPSALNIQVDTTNPSTQTPQLEVPVADKDGSEEHNGEVVVEAEEDTVIYWPDEHDCLDQNFRRRLVDDTSLFVWIISPCFYCALACRGDQ